MSEETPKERLARLEERVDQMEKDVQECKEQRVSQKEFEPIKTIVFGAVGLILITVLGGLLALVIIQRS